MAGRQRPFIGVLSLGIQRRTTSEMENGSSGADASCGKGEFSRLESF